MIVQFYYTYCTVVVVLVLLSRAADAYCPTDEQVLALCSCQSSSDGIVLDCSNGDGLRTIDILRHNHAKLGLLLELKMRNCSIVELGERIFHGLYVKKLDLAENSIEQIDINAFDGLKNILQIGRFEFGQQSYLRRPQRRFRRGQAQLADVEFGKQLFGRSAGVGDKGFQKFARLAFATEPSDHVEAVAICQFALFESAQLGPQPNPHRLQAGICQRTGYTFPLLERQCVHSTPTVHVFDV
ncbi:conserved hypothetical protein [Trichinella spiralis]|uniref:hypothetical protein n=1 Tax=Trichinella spiralis TaxID=6334 RepID=UPI0001EFBB91|nr:conserved hypothetical protein [Trichinella spiralis]